MTNQKKDSVARPDRRRARTRAAIVEAGQTLLAERALEGVSIDEIAQVADVARGSFYNHFPDKESLALEIVEQVRDSLATEIRLANAEEPEPALAIARGLCTVLSFGLNHREKAGALTRLMPGTTSFDAPLNLLAREPLQAGLAQGVFSEVTVEEGLVLVIGASMLMLHHALERKDPGLDPVAYASALAGGLLRGLGADFALARNAAAAAAREVFADFAKRGRHGYR